MNLKWKPVQWKCNENEALWHLWVAGITATAVENYCTYCIVYCARIALFGNDQYVQVAASKLPNDVMCCVRGLQTNSI